MMQASALVLACLLGGALANSALRGKALDPVGFVNGREAGWDRSGDGGAWATSRQGPGGVVLLPEPSDSYGGGEDVRDPRLAAATKLTKKLDAEEDAKLVDGPQGLKVNLREEGPAGGIQYDDKKFKNEWRKEWDNGDYPSYKKTYSKETFPGRKAIVAAADSQSDGKISPGLTGPNVGAYLKPPSTHLLEHHQHRRLLTSEGLNGDLNPEDMPQSYAEKHMLDNGNQGRFPLHYHGTPLMGWGLPAPDYDSKGRQAPYKH